MQGAELNITENFRPGVPEGPGRQWKVYVGSLSFICHYDRHQMWPLIFVGHKFCIFLIKKNFSFRKDIFLAQMTERSFSEEEEGLVLFKIS